MERETLIMAFVSCCIGLINGEYPWDGECGTGSGHEWCQLGFPPVVPFTDIDLLANAAPWHVTLLLTRSDNVAVTYASAALIRVSPSQEFSDMAVTDYRTCEMIWSNPEKFTARFGSPYAPWGMVSVLNCRRHPGHSSERGANAIGIIQFSAPVPLTGPIRPICLPPPREMASWKTGTHGTVIGLGLVNLETSANTLRRLDLQIIQQNQCSRRQNSNAVFCVTDANGGIRNLNRGDSGTPFVTNENGRCVMSGVIEDWYTGDQVLGHFQPTPVVRMSSIMYSATDNWFEQTIRNFTAVRNE